MATNEMIQLDIQTKDGKSYSFPIVDQEARALAQQALDAASASGGGSGPIQYITSLDEANLANLRDLPTGTYVLYGYFYPHPGAADTLTCDNTLASVAHLSAGSHVLVFNPLNCKVNFLEILVDETADSGFTYSVQIIDMRDLPALIEAVGSLNDLATTEKGSIVGAINEVAANAGSSDSTQNVSNVDVSNIKTVLGNIMTILKAQVEDEDGTPQGYNMDVSGLVAQNDTLIAALGTSDDSGDSGGSGEDSGGDSGETEKTLTSISAEYSGGDVTVGTALADLTGITVKATYSDGTSENVAGYTLSGTIAEGSNTISVTYQGKTATFTVTGVAESTGGGEESTSAELTMTTHSNGSGTFSNFYSDGGETTTEGRNGTVWISDKIAAEDDEVTITVLYGMTNTALTQFAANVESVYGPDAYYYEQIGYAQSNAYTVKYTVKAGQRLAIFNYNSGFAQSITVTTENPDAWPDIVNTNLYDGRYEVGSIKDNGTINTDVTSAVTTDYIDCAGIGELYTLIGGTGQYANKLYRLNAVWFDADKTVLSQAGSVSPPSATKEPMTAPSGAAFVRISYATYIGVGGYVYVGTKSLPHETEYVAISTLIE